MIFDNPRMLSPQDVLRWLTLYDSALACALQLIAEGIKVPQLEFLSDPPDDVGKPDAKRYVSSCKQELDLAGVFTLIAAAEGRIRLDVETRKQQMEDQLGRRFNVLGAKVHHLWQIPLYEGGIIDAWKMYIASLATLSSRERAQLLTSIGKLRNLLTVRHWLAHGRYWQAPHEIERYSAETVADIVSDLYEALRMAAAYGGAMAFA